MVSDREVATSSYHEAVRRGPRMRRNMYLFNRLTAIVLTAALLGPMLPLEARTKKGDKFLAEGRDHEEKKEWDAALEPTRRRSRKTRPTSCTRWRPTKVRFQAAQSHIDQGLETAGQGQLGRSPARIPEGLRHQSRVRRRPSRKSAAPGNDRARAQTRARKPAKRPPPKSARSPPAKRPRRKPRTASPASCRFRSSSPSTRTRSICA